MNPQFDKPNLPPPLPEMPPVPAMPNPEQPAASQPEIAPSAPEPQARPAMPNPSTAVQTSSTDQQGLMTNNAVNDTTPVSTPVIADDNDLIEKEWVIKAKEIVEKTRDDPHRQSTDMTIFRADYMQKRYNKTIKLPE